MSALVLNLTTDRKSIPRFLKIDSLPFHIGSIAYEGEGVTAEVFDNILRIGMFHVLTIVR